MSFGGCSLDWLYNSLGTTICLLRISNNACTVTSTSISWQIFGTWGRAKMNSISESYEAWATIIFERDWYQPSWLQRRCRLRLNRSICESVGEYLLSSGRKSDDHALRSCWLRYCWNYDLFDLHRSPIVLTSYSEKPTRKEATVHHIYV